MMLRGVGGNKFTPEHIREFSPLPFIVLNEVPEFEEEKSGPLSSLTRDDTSGKKLLGKEA